MTIGVHNDFRSSTAHSDELWFQGGGRLCYNVGSWDSELNTIIGTPGAGTSHGGVKHEWRINNSAKMTLDNSGDLGIGENNPTHKLHVVGNIYATGNVTAYSDKRNKKNLQVIDDSLRKIEKINGYTYEKDNVRYTGLVAQEVLSILPEAVVGNEEDGYALAYGNMVGILVEAIKELSGKVKSLEEKLYS